MFLKLRLKISNFIKQNKNKILIAIIILIIIILINYFLGHRKKESVLNTTYEPHEILMSNSGETVPEKLREPIQNFLDDFINYCNKKDYQSGYNLLSEDCKVNVFENSVEKFKTYVDEVFPNEKIYSIQSYSSKDDSYIYNVKILNNILESGLTDEEYSYYEEKYMIKQEKDKLTLNVANYMGKDEIKRVAEDDNLKIKVTEKIMYYDEEIYNITITNKTENIMVIADNFEPDEVLLSVGNGTRNSSNQNLYIVLEPGQTNSYKIRFTKYYDESNSPDSIVFDKIRILESYSGNIDTKQQEIDNAIKLYSLGVPIK